jgi:glycosyl transferase family 25
MSVWEFVSNAARFAAAVRQPAGPAAPSAERHSPLPIFVINLERADHRRRFIQSHLGRLGLDYELFRAVDGRSLDRQHVEQSGIYDEKVALEKFSRPLSMAEIGCALSHLGVYKTIVERGLEAAIVLEDDAMFNADFWTRMPELLAELPAEWDLVQLIYSCRDVEPAGPHLVKFTMTPTMPVAATAYILSRAGAQKLIDNALPLRYPADSLLGRAPRWGTNVYGARPHLVSINNVFPSAIARDRNVKSKAGRVIREAVVRLLG